VTEDWTLLIWTLFDALFPIKRNHHADICAFKAIWCDSLKGMGPTSDLKAIAQLASCSVSPAHGVSDQKYGEG